MMVGFDKQYPEYGFAGHKGYGSAAHLEALRRYGPSPIHRRSFKPVRDLLGSVDGRSGWAFCQGESAVSFFRKRLGQEGEDLAAGFLRRKGL